MIDFDYSTLGSMEAVVRHCEALTKAEDAKLYAELEALRLAAAEKLNAAIRARQSSGENALAGAEGRREALTC